MRILIDSEKKKDMMYLLPWVSDGTCYNFREPTKTIFPNMTIGKPEQVETLVINCDLSSYEFISSMVNLTQLYIYKGANLKDLSFLKNLTKLRQLCILNSHIEVLDDLVELIHLKYKCYKEFPENQEHIGRFTYGFEGVCIQSDVYVGDGRELIRAEVCRSDILVNKNRITHEKIYGNPEYRELLYRDNEECD